MIVQCTSIIVTSEENVEISDFLSWPSRQITKPFHLLIYKNCNVTIF